MVAETDNASFLAGYEAGKADAIDRCLMERVPNKGDYYRAHNTALHLAVIAIRPLDGRHALSRRKVEGT